MEEQATCGKGLAENSALPALLADLTAGMAEVLEAHMRALDTADEKGRREHEAYRSLVGQQRETAARLRATATEMAGYGDLPVAPHDMAVMNDGRQLAAFETVVRTRQALLAMLQGAAERDQALLAAMRGARS